MKFLLLSVISPVFLLSCQPTTYEQQALPPVVRSSPTKTYTPKPRPKTRTTTVKTPEVKVETKELVKPLTADPANVTPLREIPRFKVPENLQPKVTDGINQGVFIELKW